MRRLALLLVLAGCGGGGVPAGSPVESTAAPPAARTLRYTVVMAGRPAGGAEVTIDPDGVRHNRYHYNDRGRGPELRSTLRLDERGLPVEMHTTGVGYFKAPVEARLRVEGDELVWESTDESGRAPRGGFFDPRDHAFDAPALMIRALERGAGKPLAVLPAGRVWIEDQSRLEVSVAGKPRTLRRVALAGLDFAPQLVWLDEDGQLFAKLHSWLSVVASGGEALVPQLIESDNRWKAARAARLAAELGEKPPTAGLVFQHARVFDAEKKKIDRDRTVVIVGDEIVAVGGAKTKVPAGAKVIDARGRLLVPGLWDMHVHMSDNDGVLALAAGVTTVRDLGNQTEELSARAARFEAGQEIGPRVLRAGLVDGPGELAVAAGVLAGDEEEARAAVKRFADLGYQQIKIYSSLAPALVPVIVAEAHARGLRVSGHIPQGMSAEMAVVAGFDEIQHANMLFLDFLATPADDTRGPARFQVVARGAAGLDLESAPVKAFLALLKKRKTVLDPTLVAFEPMFTSDPGQLEPAIAAYKGRLPAAVERDSVGGGLAAADAAERERFRDSFAALGRLIRAAWKLGIPVVAGTDRLIGFSLPRELELYVAAGIPAAEVLALATLGAARVMQLDRVSGSIRVGKQADLVLVDGDPTRDMADIRKVDLVVSRGVLYDSGELLLAVGCRPR